MKKSTIALLLFFILSSVILLNKEVDATEVDLKRYPGAQFQKVKNLKLYPFKPTAKLAFKDMPNGYIMKCHANVRDTKINICGYGKMTNYNYTVAIIGDSHSGHWLGALQEYALKYKIRILYATKSGCTLTSDRFETYPECTTWNKNIIPTIAKYQPDVVLTKSEYSDRHHKTVPQGMINKFIELKKHKINVFAVRDTPYFNVNVPACVEKYGIKSKKCMVKKREVVPVPSDWDKVKKKPSNVYYYDYTNRLCPDKYYCKPVIGNVLLMRDKHHMTDTYSRTLGYYVIKDLLPILRTSKANKVVR